MSTLLITETMYDLDPNNPLVITDGVSIECTSTKTLVYVGTGKQRFSIICKSAADISVVDSNGSPVQFGVDYKPIQNARDKEYSKLYNMVCYSGFSFARTGVYTVTKFTTIGVYPRAAWYNAITLFAKTFAEETWVWIQTQIANINATLSSAVSTIADHETRISSLEETPPYIIVADHAAMLALTNVQQWARIYVIADTDGHLAEYVWDGTEYKKTADPDWENINIDFNAIINKPANIAALASAPDISTASTGQVPAKSASGGIEWKTPAEAEGVGDVISDSSSAIIGHVPIISSADGKHIKSSEYPLFYVGKIEWFDDYFSPAADFPYLCLSDADKLLDVANWPDLVPYLRAKKLKYMPGTASAQSDFNVTNFAIASNVVTLTFSNLTPEIAILKVLAEDNLVHGSFTNWRTITLPVAIGAVTARTYAITDINTTNRTISFAFTAANLNASSAVTATVAFYPHRPSTAEDGTGVKARHFSVKGRTLVSPNDDDGECIAGLRRRDRMQGHFHQAYGVTNGSTYVIPRSGTGTTTISGQFATNQIREPKTDDTNGTPRTGKTTDPRALIAVPYICGGQYVA